MKAGLKADGRIYASLVAAYLQTGFIDKAEDLFNSIKQTNMDIAKSMYRPFIKQAAKVGNFERIETLLKEMRDAGIQPNEHIYNIIISAQALRGNSTGIQATLETMQKEGLSTSSPDTYDVLLSAYTQVGDKTRVRSTVIVN